jgi:cystathionine beta-lyase/cystathionine gamma-synthase
MKYETLILHNGNETDEETGALSIPIYNTSTFHQKDPSVRQAFDYSRSGNPTRSALEKTAAALESGTHGFAYASGMAAISSTILALFRPGDHLIVTKDIYGGAYRFFSQFASEFGIEITFTDLTDLTDLSSAENLVKPNTKGIYIESPTNPLMKIIDVAGTAAFAKKHGIISLIDNTFMSPALMRPLDMGIDVTIHSATKFLSGHSDLIAGVTVVKDDALAEKIYFVQNCLGAVLGPNDAWLLMRGIKTLAARMKLQSEAAAVIAQKLTSQPWVRAVYYPGLAAHPGHEIIAAQASGFGAVLSFRTDTAERAKQILSNVRLWAVAVSLGGVESILSYPCMMSHASIPKKERDELGITEDLIRLSVGLEDAGDLFEDIAASAQ